MLYEIWTVVLTRLTFSSSYSLNELLPFFLSLKRNSSWLFDNLLAIVLDDR